MLRIIQSDNAAAAKGYYAQGDYYLDGQQEFTGQWGGKAAERLGLAGAVDQPSFEALCDNLHPNGSGRLTLATKDKRRVGYDFNFHVPKSVSVLYGLTEDAAILDAFRVSVAETMDEMEADVRTRVRKGGKREDRIAGNWAYAEFIHFTARPVGGVPDPHLHAHCFVQNACWDDKERAWKAIDVAAIKRDAGYYEAAFHARLARRVAELYPVERTAKAWEVAGLADVSRKFSRRTQEIEQLASDKGIVSADAKAELGAKTRRGKQKELSLDELRELWNGRLTAGDATALVDVVAQRGGPAPALAEDAALAYAIGHCFERSAAVPETALLTEALRHGVGAVTVEGLRDKLDAHGVIHCKVDGRMLCSTREVLAEERRMIGFAADGLGTQAPLGPRDWTFSRAWLNKGQKMAIKRLLASTSTVFLIRGAAGAGKTASMQEAVEAIEAGGRKVFTFAPSAQASRDVLRKEGFADADTVARLLVDAALQERIKDQVLWIDEAGLLGTRMMTKIFELAEKRNARVVLSGDNKQHGAVERGDVLRVLEDYTGIRAAVIDDIQRQRGDYKEAIKALSKGKAEEGWSRLDALGWIHELPDGERERRLAADYAEVVAKGLSALVVTPTHAEGRQLTAAIRDHLRGSGTLQAEEREVLRLENRNLTEAERGQAHSLAAGDLLVFHQNAARGIRKGARVTVSGEAGQTLPLDAAARFQVYRPGTLTLAPGDKIRITANGTTADGRHRLNNGAIFAVKGFDAGGNITLDNGWTVAKDYGHLAYGYVTTSHASQGKTVDRVFIGQSSASLPASSREQFYVSASRARQQVSLYTDDKAALREAIQRPETRAAASDLVARKKPTLKERLKRHWEQRRRWEWLNRAREAEESARREQLRERQRGHGGYER